MQFASNRFVSSSVQPEEPVDGLLLENVEVLAGNLEIP